MKVMVTGGTGYVGAYSVKALLDAGHRVRLLVRNPGGSRRTSYTVHGFGAQPSGDEIA